MYPTPFSKHPLLVFVWVVLCPVCFAVCSPSAIHAADVVVKQWELGVGGQWKVGHWASLRMTVESAERFDGTVTISAPDGEAAQVDFLAEAVVAIEPGKETVITRLIKIGRPSGVLRATFRPSSDAANSVQSIHSVSIDSLSPLPAQSAVLLHLGHEALFGDPRCVRKMSDWHVHSIAAADLPLDWEALQCVDSVWLAESEIGSLQEEQVRALARWNQLGGRLVLCAGRTASALLSNSAWSDHIRGQLDSATERRFGGGIEEYANAQTRLDTFFCASLAMDDPNTEVLATAGTATGEVPAIVRAPSGLGILTFVGLDLSEPPFASWDATVDLVIRLAGGRTSDRTVERQRGRVRYVGYDDLSGQLRSALDEYSTPESSPEASRSASPSPSEDSQTAAPSGVRMIAFSLVVLMLVLYALLLGPGDYFLLRRFQIPEWTWLTFPALVIAFCCLFVWLRGNLNGPDPLLNQVDLVDLDAVTGAVRGTHWSQVYSPKTSHWDIDFSCSQAIDGKLKSSGRTLAAWQGLPGGALGGMEAESTAGTLQDSYRAELATTKLLGVPMRTASTRSLAASWWSVAETDPERLSSLTSANGNLRGTFRSPLTVDLEDCVLFFDNFVHLFDGARLEAGELVRAEDLPVRRDIGWRLNEKKIADGKSTRYQTTPWDVEGRSVPRIMETLMFYEAAGGEQYTTLQHDYQRALDMSEHLKMGRAVLVGRSRESSTRVDVDGAPLPGQRWNFYRIVYPVLRAKP